MPIRCQLVLISIRLCSLHTIPHSCCWHTPHLQIKAFIQQTVCTWHSAITVLIQHQLDDGLSEVAAAVDKAFQHLYFVHFPSDKYILVRPQSDCINSSTINDNKYVLMTLQQCYIKLSTVTINNDNYVLMTLQQSYIRLSTVTINNNYVLMTLQQCYIKLSTVTINNKYVMITLQQCYIKLSTVTINNKYVLITLQQCYIKLLSHY